MVLDERSPVPLHAQLLASLRARLQAGEWQPGTLLPAEAELCREYSVSRITVARALAELAREGVVQRQRGRGTTVLAPPGATKQPAALAFVTPHLNHEWPLRIYSGFEAAAVVANHYAMLTGTQDDHTIAPAQVRTLLTGHARALALCLATIPPRDWPSWQALRARGIPFTFIGTYNPLLAADRVVADNVGAGQLAVRHLLALGHQRIAFLCYSQQQLDDNTAYQGRLRGYQQALRDAGLDPGAPPAPASWILPAALPATLSDAEQRDWLLAFLERTRVTAAVTCNDALAVLVQRYLLPVGVRIPDDLAFVGISDERIAAFADVPLTTVRLDAPALGDAAARLLLERLGGDTTPPREVIVPVSLVVRASCGAPTADDRTYSSSDALRDAALMLGSTGM
jgi:GntR family transcriptional regulator, arabinose operon transcriptional repressor